MSKELITTNVQELKAIEQSRAAQIAAAFSPMSSRLAEFEECFNSVITDAVENGITEEITKKAKRLRIDIGKIRIETGKIKDSQKENIKLEDKAIMGVHNWLVLAVKEKEDRLYEIEKHFEKMEEEKRQKLKESREKELSQYTDVFVSGLDTMEETVWAAFIAHKKREYEERIEAEKKAEEERIENERLDKIENERYVAILPLRQFWTCDNYALRTMSQTNFETIVSDLKKAKSDYEAEQEKIRIENERLKKEAEEKERIRIAEEKKRKAAEEKERKEREEAARKEREAHEAALKKEREERERIEREEKERRERLEAELKEKREAEESAKAAEEARIQAELNKGDAEKVADLVADLKAIQTKYSFKSKDNKKMYSDVIALVDKIIAHIEK